MEFAADNQGICVKIFEDIILIIGSNMGVTKMTIEAGCDIVLHCSGDLEEMQAVCRELYSYSI